MQVFCPFFCVLSDFVSFFEGVSIENAHFRRIDVRGIRFIQKITQFLRKYTKKFAYMQKKQYLCARNE